MCPVSPFRGDALTGAGMNRAAVHADLWMVPVPHHSLDFEFSCRALSEQIVRSAVTHDPVRLERAITAAIDLHGGAAERTVFAPARLAAAAVGPACAALVARAIDTYVHVRRAA